MKAKSKYPLADLDNLQFRMKCCSDLVWAVHEAMQSGNFTAESYLDALYGAHRYIETLTGEMRDLVDALFEESRAKKKEAAKK